MPCRTCTASMRSRVSSRAHARPTCSSPTAPNSRSAGCRCCCRSRATAKVQPGTPGYFEATAQLKLIEVPTSRRPLDGRHPCAGQPARAARPAQHRADREGAHRATRAIDPANAGYYEGRELGFSEPVAGGDRALGGGGGAPEGRAGRGDAQGPVISLPLARAQAACRNRAQARCATQRRLPCGTRDDALRPRRRG